MDVRIPPQWGHVGVKWDNVQVIGVNGTKLSLVGVNGGHMGV
jgi:hypothetical protein